MNKSIISDFIKIYKAEWFKTRKTLALRLMILYPFICILLVSLKFLGKQIPAKPWQEFITQANNVMAFFLPFMLILMVSFITQLEYKNYGWKQIYAQPVSRLSVFLGKYAMIVSLTLLSMVIAFFIIIGLGLLLHVIKPGLDFSLSGYSFDTFIRLFLKTFLAGIFTITLQYWICMRLKGFMAPIMAGVFFTILPIAYIMILGMAGLMNKRVEVLKFFEYDPYSFSFSTPFHSAIVKTTETAWIPDILQIHLGLALVILILAALDNQRRSVFA